MPMVETSSGFSTLVRAALERSRVRVGVDAALQALPLDERAMILVDLLADYEGATPARAARPAAPTRTSLQNDSPSEAEEGSSVVTNDDGRTVADRLLTILGERSEASIEQLSQALYGSSDAAHRNRLSTSLTHLKRAGKAEMVRRGWWRLAEPKRTRHASQPKSAQPKRAQSTNGLAGANRRAKLVRSPAGPKQPKESRAGLSFAATVRGVLAEHPEGLTTGQLRDLIGPSGESKKISTLVTKMRIAGSVVASGEKGASVYRLADGARSASEGED
jgi:hypothetical protein